MWSRKVDNLFYRLDLDQIDGNLYEEFVERKKKEEENLSKEEKDKRMGPIPNPHVKSYY